MKLENNAPLPTIGRAVLAYLKRNLGILVALFGLIILLSVTKDTFLTPKNIFNVLRQITTNALLAFGMTLVVLTGGIDLSVGSILALSSMLTCGAMVRWEWSVALAVLFGLILGAAMGCFNGVVIAKTSVPPFIATLGMFSMARGCAYLYTNGQPIRVFTPGFNEITNTFIGPVSVPIIYMLVIFIALILMLNFTKFGRYIYAVGGNEEAAKYSGVPVARTKILVYTISGLLSSIAGILLASRMYTGQPTVGEGAELTAVAAAVLGGTRMSGGVGTLGGTIIGCMVIGIINNGLNLLGVSSYLQTVTTGVIILLAVYFDTQRSAGKNK